MAQFVLEESYEVVEAINSGKIDKIKEKAGDLLQVLVMLCRIAERQKKFEIGGVAEGVANKLIRRHPHVFGDVKVSGSGEVLKNWEQIKQEERKAKKDEDASAVAGVPTALPGLLRAFRTGEKAARVGFEWPDMNGPIDKVEEEWAELRAELKSGASEDKLESELGDVLFALATLARHAKINPEIALQKTTHRFIERFRYVETHLGKPMKEATLSEIEALWEEAKGKGI